MVADGAPKVQAKISQSDIDLAKTRPASGVENIQNLPGPTGESNILKTTARGVVLCLGPADAYESQQRIAAENGAIAVLGDCDAKLLATLRGFDGVAYWGDADTKRKLRKALAGRAGPIIPLITTAYALQNLVREQHICIDTTAAGGNAALLAGE